MLKTTEGWLFFDTVRSGGLDEGEEKVMEVWVTENPSWQDQCNRFLDDLSLNKDYFFFEMEGMSFSGGSFLIFSDQNVAINYSRLHPNSAVDEEIKEVAFIDCSELTTNLYENDEEDKIDELNDLKWSFGEEVILLSDSPLAFAAEKTPKGIELLQQVYHEVSRVCSGEKV